MVVADDGSTITVKVGPSKGNYTEIWDNKPLKANGTATPNSCMQVEVATQSYVYLPFELNATSEPYTMDLTKYDAAELTNPSLASCGAVKNVCDKNGCGMLTQTKKPQPKPTSPLPTLHAKIISVPKAVQQGSLSILKVSRGGGDVKLFAEVELESFFCCC